MGFPALQAAGGLHSPQLLRGSPALTSVVVTTVLSVFLGTGHRRGCWVQKAKEIFGPAASPVPTPTRSIRQRRWRGEDRYFLTFPEVSSELAAKLWKNELVAREQWNLYLSAFLKC